MTWDDVIIIQKKNKSIKIHLLTDNNIYLYLYKGMPCMLLSLIFLKCVKTQILINTSYICYEISIIDSKSPTTFNSTKTFSKCSCTVACWTALAMFIPNCLADLLYCTCALRTVIWLIMIL